MGERMEDVLLARIKIFAAVAPALKEVLVLGSNAWAAYCATTGSEHHQVTVTNLTDSPVIFQIDDEAAKAHTIHPHTMAKFVVPVKPVRGWFNGRPLPASTLNAGSIYAIERSGNVHEYVRGEDGELYERHEDGELWADFDENGLPGWHVCPCGQAG